MKLLMVILLFASFKSFGEVNCDVEAGPTIPSEVLNVAETIVDVNQHNNTCPNRPYENYFEAATNLTELKTQVNARLSAMGITAEWEAGNQGNASWQAFTDTPEDLVRARRLANVTVAAMSQYPPGFFNHAGLNKIKLIKDFRYNYKGTSQARMAMPEPSSDRLYFGENNEPGLTSCLEEIEMRMHHELFHLIEGTVHHDMTPNIRSWNRLNSEGFRYGQGGASAYSDGTDFSHLERPIDGFSTGYATFGGEEDRSEVFAYMMTRGFSERQSGWATVDPILNRKIRHIQNFLREELEVSPDFFNRSTN